MASPKLDGIRCVIRNGKPLTRNLKTIPNKYVREKLTGLPQFDGELIVGDPVAKDVWNATQSGIMSEDGEPDFGYFVFDMAWGLSHTFAYRYDELKDMVDDYRTKRVEWLELVQHVHIDTIAQLEAYEAKAVEQGWEGIMLRNPGGLYKQGRSTMREQGLMKVKRFMDAEAVVVGVVEKMTNLNPAKINKLGLTERSSHKGNKRGAGTMGALVCKNALVSSKDALRDVDYSISSKTTFEIGTGFTDDMRLNLWMYRDKLKGSVVKFKYQGLSPDGVPRFPVFLGWRKD
jgi:DNA ligase-1